MCQLCLGVFFSPEDSCAEFPPFLLAKFQLGNMRNHERLPRQKAATRRGETQLEFPQRIPGSGKMDQRYSQTRCANRHSAARGCRLATLILLSGLTLALSSTYNMELTHSGSCGGGLTRCTLPVNANITLLDLGAGGVTDAVVSIDVYPDNTTLTPDPAILHTLTTYTAIRVWFPSGFDVCNSFVALQGAESGVTLRNTPSANPTYLPFFFNEPVGKGDNIPEPSIKEILQPLAGEEPPRTGGFPPSDFGSMDCDISGLFSTCRDRSFEIRSSSADSTSSRVAGTVQRIQFVISNVRTKPEPGDIPYPLDTSGEPTGSMFRVQIFHVRRTPTGPTTFDEEASLRYYNNIINDPRVNKLTS